VNTLREDLSLTSTVEPLRDLRITLTANRNRTMNFSSNFRYSNERGGFENLSPYTTGDYNISFISLRTAFSDKNGSTTSGLYRQFMANRAVVSQRLGAQNGNSNAGNGAFADGYNEQAQDVLVAAFVAAYTGKDASAVRLKGFPKIPLPNWRINYGGLSRLGFMQETFKSIDIRHSYRATYAVNNFNSLQQYQEIGGSVSSRDLNNNFLPALQYSQVTITEQFAPLIGVDTRLKNNLTANFEIGKNRLLGLSLGNNQLAQLSENNMVFGLGYRTNRFRFPFGLFQQVRLDNAMDIKLDVAVRDNKTVIYRGDVDVAEVSSGAKNIALRPSVDYMLNQRLNVRLFYDSNITKPYTSLSYNTAYSNFGFSLRVTLN
jgi:cell surface protein SprA